MEPYIKHLHSHWFFAIFLFCGALVASNLVHWILFRILRRKETQGRTPGWGIQQHLGRPSRVIFILTCVLIALPAVPVLPSGWEEAIRHWTVMAIVAALGWFFVGLIYVVQSGILRKYDLNAANNMRARSIHTQFQVFRRLLIGFVVIITIGALLWTSNDPRIWHYGSGLLASAGIASLLIASAAKSTASNLLAGIQIAFTEPIRIDDVVVVKGDWGKIEEITSAYVVLKIWDLRRLIVPLSYFIENPIENWTRTSTQILGYPYLYVDYSIPVAEVRKEYENLVRNHHLWDGEAIGLQVTDTSATTMQLRCLYSARNSSDSFDLGCDIREHMIAFIQQNYPEAFPTTRFAARPIAIRSEESGAGPKQLPETTKAA